MLAISERFIVSFSNIAERSTSRIGQNPVEILSDSDIQRRGRTCTCYSSTSHSNGVGASIFKVVKIRSGVVLQMGKGILSTDHNPLK